MLAASFALALVPFAAVTPAGTSARAVTPVDALRAQLLGALGASSATVWGAQISVGGVGTVVSRNAGLPLPPASLEKIPLAVSLLLSTAPDRRLDTTVGVTGPVTADGVLRGDLVLTAGGNPVLRGTDLVAIARAVRAAGIRAIPGTVWIDDSRYDRARLAPGWKPSFVPLEVGPLSAFAVNGNAWRRDPAFLADPVPANLAAFRTLLFRAGVGVPGAAASGVPPRAPASSPCTGRPRSPSWSGSC